MAAHLPGTGATPGAGATGDCAQELPQSLHQECMQRSLVLGKGLLQLPICIFTVDFECKE